VEGALTIVVAIVAFFFLPDTPGKAKFLSEEEQWYIVTYSAQIFKVKVLHKPTRLKMRSSAGLL
jgi:hypothetical protein